MINYYEIMKNLEKYSHTIKTTKELKEAGLNKYYIKKAVSEKKLKKVARGKYRINSEFIIYNNLKSHICNKQFEEAYNDLKNNEFKKENKSFFEKIIEKIKRLIKL